MRYPHKKFTDWGIRALPLPAGPERSTPHPTDFKVLAAGGAETAGVAELIEPGSPGIAGRTCLQADYFDPARDPPGFGVRVSYKGTRTWIFMYRYNGVKRRMNLGVVGQLGLRAARDLAKDAFEAVRKGGKEGDPAASRRSNRAKVETVKELAAGYIAEYARPRKRSWKKDEQILGREVIPFIGRKRVVDVTRQDIREEVLKRIVARDAPVRANHTLEVIRKMFNWAIQEKDLVPFNPAALLQKPGGDREGRSRYLLVAEFPRFWAALEDRLLGEAGAIYFMVLTLTGQREMELLRSRWTDIDFDDGLWTIPADNAKNRNEHIVPLPPHALALFRRLRSIGQEGDEFVFQSRKTQSHMRRVFVEKRIIKIRKVAALGDFTVHDLRRSATTYWGKLNIDAALKKRLLNHSRRADVTAIYDRFEYLDQKRDALARWEKLLFEMAGGRSDGESTANVVRLSRASL